MAAPADLLRQVLQTDQARAWLARLGAEFFDRAARQAVREAVAAGLPALVPGLDDGGRQLLAAGVFQELCRQASREARPPEPAPAPSPEPLSGVDLGRHVVGHYPYPVAHAYHVLNEADSPAAQFGSLLTLFEALVHYLATVVVSAYLRTDLGSAACNRQLLDVLLRGKWTTGLLYALLRDTVRHGGDAGGRLPYRALPALLFDDRGRPTPSGAVLESLVELRNEEWGHGGTRTDDYYAPLVSANRPRLEGQLARMPWLADWSLVRPVAVAGGRLARADLLNGTTRWKCQPFDLALEPADLDPDGGDVRVDREALLLVAPDRGSYLPLFPLQQFRVSSQAAYFLHGLDWSSSRPPCRLRKAVYLAYNAKESRHEELSRDFAASAVERHVGRLLALAPSAAVTPPAPAGDPDLTLPEVATEQQSHLRGLVGREALLAELSAWIDRRGDGGYLLLLGPPGQGKSALLAELARREAARGGCLLHMVKSHPQPRRFVPALLSQAARLARTAFGTDTYRGGTDDLRNALVRALEAVREAAGRAVVVIDALDELEPGAGRITFLPPVLPSGVRVVLSCRPDIPLVGGLRARLRGGLEERAVPPLSAADFRALLGQRLGAAAVGELGRRANFDELFARMGGNPLFLRCFVEALAGHRAGTAPDETAPALDPAAVPTSLEAVCQDMVRRVRQRRDGEAGPAEGRQRLRLLELLCLAREPLGLDALSGLMAAGGESLFLDECRDRVEELSQWLLEASPGRFKPWHQALTDHLRGEVLGAAGVRQLEEVFGRWLGGPEAARGAYGLRHRPGHLLALSRWDDLAALLTDWRFLEAKAEAGLVFDLAGDFTQVVQDLPRAHPSRRLLGLLEEAIRRDLHFLARHPAALFQCLWNTGWWYDCAEAAAHYDPPEEGWPAGGPPWEQPGPRLCSLLESWRAAKSAAPGQPWLRSLRPPPHPLGTAQRAVYHGHEGAVASVAFAPDGSRLASGSRDRSVRVWDAAGGAQVLRLEGHRASITCVTFSADGARLASASSDRTVRVWDAARGTELACLQGHTQRVWTVAFSPDGRHLVSGSDDWTLRVWDVERRAEVRCCRFRALSEHGAVVCVAFAPDGRRFLSGLGDGTIRTWDMIAAGEPGCLRGHEGAVTGLAFSPDGRLVASAGAEGTIRLWDGRTGAAGPCFEVRTTEARGLSDLRFSPDGRRLAVSGEDGTVRVWDVGRGAEIACLRGHEARVHGVAFSPDGRWLASASSDRTVRLWDPAVEPARARLRDHAARVRVLAISPDGRHVASGAEDCAVRVWDAARGTPLACALGHEAVVVSLAFSPDGRQVASGDKDGTVRVWGVIDGRPIACCRGHLSAVTCLAFSADGRRLASGSWEGGVFVWEASSGNELACLRGHTDSVRRLSFAADGREVVSAAADNTIRTWDVASAGCSQVGAGRGDDGAVSSPSWRVRVGELEMTLERPSDGEAAWFPARPDLVQVHPSRHAWAGAERTYLRLLALEEGFSA